MVIFTKDSFNISCANCDKEIKISRHNFDIGEPYIYPDSENKMGEEISTHYSCEFHCPECGEKICIDFITFEYPIGCLNDIDNSESYGFKYSEQLPIAAVFDHVEFSDPDDINTQSIDEIIKTVASNPALIYELRPRNFEIMVAQLFYDKGFETRLTPATRDGGYDILAMKPNPNNNEGEPILFYIECKRYNEINKIDVKTVRALYGVQTADKVHQSILVTSSYFTSDATGFANKVNKQSTTGEEIIKLMDRDLLQTMIDESAQKYQEQQMREAEFYKYGRYRT